MLLLIYLSELTQKLCHCFGALEPGLGLMHTYEIRIHWLIYIDSVSSIYKRSKLILVSILELDNSSNQHSRLDAFCSPP